MRGYNTIKKRLNKYMLNWLDSNCYLNLNYRNVLMFIQYHYHSINN